MSTVMDMFFNNSETISLQEMLDIDIKSEIDTLIAGSAADLSDFNSINFNDLPPLELDELHDIRWYNPFDDDSNAIINTNAVLPVFASLSQNVRSPSPSLKESHLTFSPSNMKPMKQPQPSTETVTTVKRDLLKKIDTSSMLSSSHHHHHHHPHRHTIIEKKKTTPIIKTSINKVTPILSKSIVKTVKGPTLLSFRNTINRRITTPVTVTQLTNLGTVRAITTTASNNQRKQQFNNRLYEEDVKAFPKPAYSYSCLIAMALKNSKTGSLPVSEIYNFMCKHFPYFKTAPNGWKNSVRHNLSLNKCFEKIEKPAVNGSTRKGCLWAMNPSKISKMDEEVQKWSRKDPSAIRKAMVKPDNLEALERGELKFSCSYDEDVFGDSCGSAESEEGSDSEVEVERHPHQQQHVQYINIRDIKNEVEEEEEEDGEEFDVEVADSMYDDDIDEDHEILRMEMALAQKELLEYERNNKRRKTFIIQN